MSDPEASLNSPWVAEFLNQAPSIPLGPGAAWEDGKRMLNDCDDTTLFGEGGVSNREMAACCRAGLWLRAGWLDRSHTISQSVHTPEGSYWHGIMHRHEPDYGNAKYWFRQTGQHPIFETLATRVAALAAQSDAPAATGWNSIQRWDAAKFVDFCQNEERGGDSYDFCAAVVNLEWEILFDFCFRSATK